MNINCIAFSGKVEHGLQLGSVGILGTHLLNKPLVDAVWFQSLSLAFLILLYFGIQVRLPLPAPVNYLLTFLWVAGISHAINFLDNMDG